MPPLFTAAQLDAEFSTSARAWHLLRKRLPGIGWRDLHQPEATIEGLIVRGEASDDGDVCFDVLVPPHVYYHCEVDPDDRPMFRDALLRLEAGTKVRVSGTLVADLGHGTLELHPVTALGTTA